MRVSEWEEVIFKGHESQGFRQGLVASLCRNSQPVAELRFDFTGRIIKAP